MTITKEDVREAERNAAEANQKMADMRRQYAVQQCPLNVGDIVDVLGWSHVGKRMKINRIMPPRYNFDGDWRVYGVVLTKDGNPGKFTANFSHKDWEAKHGS